MAAAVRVCRGTSRRGACTMSCRRHARVDRRRRSGSRPADGIPARCSGRVRTAAATPDAASTSRSNGAMGGPPQTPDRTKLNAPNEASALYGSAGEAGASSKQERTTAPSPGRLNGLVIRWLAPASRARSTSASADSDVKTSTGIDCVCGCDADMPAHLDPVDARHHHVEDRQVELLRCRACDSASVPSWASLTSNPSMLRYNPTTCSSRGSSSTRRMRCWANECDLPGAWTGASPQYRARRSMRSGRPSFRHRAATSPCRQRPRRIVPDDVRTWWSHESVAAKS